MPLQQRDKKWERRPMRDGPPLPLLPPVALAPLPRLFPARLLSGLSAAGQQPVARARAGLPHLQRGLLRLVRRLGPLLDHVAAAVGAGVEEGHAGREDGILHLEAAPEGGLDPLYKGSEHLAVSLDRCVKA